MAFMFAMGYCVACRKLINFNPMCVPSLIVNGNREPLCRDCADEWNRIHRTSNGLSPVAIHPNAYEAEECL